MLTKIKHLPNLIYDHFIDENNSEIKSKKNKITIDLDAMQRVKYIKDGIYKEYEHRRTQTFNKKLEDIIENYEMMNTLEYNLLMHVHPDFSEEQIKDFVTNDELAKYNKSNSIEIDIDIFRKMKTIEFTEDLTRCIKNKHTMNTSTFYPSCTGVLYRYAIDAALRSYNARYNQNPCTCDKLNNNIVNSDFKSLIGSNSE